MQKFVIYILNLRIHSLKLNGCGYTRIIHCKSEHLLLFYRPKTECKRENAIIFRVLEICLMCDENVDVEATTAIMLDLLIDSRTFPLIVDRWFVIFAVFTFTSLKSMNRINSERRASRNINRFFDTVPYNFASCRTFSCLNLNVDFQLMVHIMIISR